MIFPVIWARHRSHRRLQGKFLIGLTLILSLVALVRHTALLETLQPFPFHKVDGQSSGSQTEASRREPQVHLLLPVNKDAALRGSRFCKTAAAAIMTGYKLIVYNWGSKANDVSKTHRQKITGERMPDGERRNR